MTVVSCRETLALPHVLWLDNYAHYLKVNAPTISKQMWRECLWSVCGIISMHSLADQQFLRKRPGVIVMPSRDEILTQASNIAALSYIKKREQQSTICFETSRSRDVTRVPIKPESAESARADDDRFFIPKGIFKSNIGSNTGMLKLLMDTRREEARLPNYTVLLVDVNIYWRIIKVTTFHPHISFVNMFSLSFS